MSDPKCQVFRCGSHDRRSGSLSRTYTQYGMAFPLSVIRQASEISDRRSDGS
jgi:hypothetical protein